MVSSQKCAHCGYEVPLSSVNCPHCGIPSLFPNVVAAEQREEVNALQDRYQAAIKDAAARGCDNAVAEFERQINSSAVAIISRNVATVHRLSTSTKELYATYYQQVEGGIRVPEGDGWDRLRLATDAALFSHAAGQIRFGALSLNGVGSANYGECSLVCEEAMIEHRASVFEENSVLFMKHFGIRISDVNDLPRGFRAVWKDRSKLAVAKLVYCPRSLSHYNPCDLICSRHDLDVRDLLDTTLAGQLSAKTDPSQFQSILLTQGKTSNDDELVEVHIWGSMSILSFKAVVVSRKNRRPSKAILNALQERLKRLNIPLSVN